MTNKTISILRTEPYLHRVDIRGGDWSVALLKETLGVPAYKVLARVDPFGLTALADNETFEVKDGDRFMSHVRPGVSS